MVSNCGGGEDPWVPLDSKIKPVNPTGNQLWIFIGRIDAEAEAPVLWPPDTKTRHIGKDPDAGKDRWQEVKGMAEDEMVGWHYQLNGHKFEQASGYDEGQGSLACCSPWGRKELDTTKWLNWTEQVTLSSLLVKHYIDVSERLFFFFFFQMRLTLKSVGFK